MHTVFIFTDGAARGNPGPGGWGAIIIAGEQVTEIGGGEPHTTNNRMELTAAIKALEQIQDTRSKMRVFSDSAYVVKGMTEWIHNWQRKGWKTASKKPVENRDLWEQLLTASAGKEIAWTQVGGHAGVRGNEQCDEIATAFADGTPHTLYAGVLENYRIKNILDVARR